MRVITAIFGDGSEAQGKTFFVAERLAHHSVFGSLIHKIFKVIKSNTLKIMIECDKQQLQNLLADDLFSHCETIITEEVGTDITEDPTVAILYQDSNAWAT